MKPLILAIGALALILIASCGPQDGYSSNKCFESVRQAYPHARIFHEGNSTNYNWVVIDTDNAVYHVETGNASNANITHTERMAELK